MSHKGKHGGIKRGGAPRQRHNNSFVARYGMSPSAWARRKKELRANGEGYKIQEAK